MYDVQIVKSNKYFRTVKATKNIKKNHIIEIAPAIAISNDEYTSNSILKNYVFSTWDKKTDLIAFGYGSMYNHSDKPNARWHADLKNKRLIIKANKDIKKNEEIFISYGPEYWKSRKNIIKKI